MHRLLWKFTWYSCHKVHYHTVCFSLWPYSTSLHRVRDTWGQKSIYCLNLITCIFLSAKFCIFILVNNIRSQTVVSSHLNTVCFWKKKENNNKKKQHKNKNNWYLQKSCLYVCKDAFPANIIFLSKVFLDWKKKTQKNIVLLPIFAEKLSLRM